MLNDRCRFSYVVSNQRARSGSTDMKFADILSGVSRAARFVIGRLGTGLREDYRSEAFPDDSGMH
jgi:hypothetical protein